MPKYHSFKCEQVKQAFSCYPNEIKNKLLFIRELIFEVASGTIGVGSLEETLKWGEPSYLTTQTKSGSTIRIDWKKNTPDKYYVYFNCKTTLIESFKNLYEDIFSYNGNRSLVFDKDQKLPIKELSNCITMALTYHLNKRSI